MQSPYDEGYDAAMQGYNYEDNPYEASTLEAKEWALGFSNAVMEE